MNKKYNYTILVMGIISPIFIRFLFPSTYHHSDMEIISSWNNFSDSLRVIYDTDCYCNYPFIGLFFSTGLLKLFGNSTFLYLVFLALIDSFNVLLVFLILRKATIKNAALYAGIIGLLPSSWAGGSLWGQIDNIGLSIILILIFLLLRINLQKARDSIQYFLGQIFIIGFIIGFGVLTKQLLVFTLFPISIFIISIIFIFHFNNLRKVVLILLFFVFSVLAPVILIDSWLVLPESLYFSHLEKVLMKGSSHMNKISGNGFNMWMLLDRDMWSSSKIPLFFSISPMIVGIIIFLINAFVITVIFVLKNIFVTLESNKNIIVNFLYLLALFNLSFNLFLTGTHERYLYYFYPIMLITLLIANKERLLLEINKGLFTLTIIGSILYGTFVLLILVEYRYHQSYVTLFIFHFILYGIFVRIFCQGFNYNESIIKLKSLLKNN